MMFIVVEFILKTNYSKEKIKKIKILIFKNYFWLKRKFKSYKKKFDTTFTKMSKLNYVYICWNIYDPLF